MRFLVVKSKSIICILSLLLCAVLLSVNIGYGNCASVYFGYAPRLVPIYSVDTTEKKVAITFDSAWGADKTLKIIETLKEFNVGATFFLCGFWVEEYPQMVEAIDSANLEIGTHSNTHADFVKLSKDDMDMELSSSINLIKKITNKEVELFRAPYGSYNNAVIESANEHNLKTIQWDVDSLDWKGLSATEICNRVISKVKNGSIILCHNNSEHILEALPLMLDRLQNMGYEITSVGNLIIKDNFYIDHQGIQRKK